MTMARVKTRPWDPTEHLKTDEDIVAYLEAALEDGDPELIAVVLRNIVRARGLTRVSTETAQGKENVPLVPDALQSGAVTSALRALGTRLQATTRVKLASGLPRVPQLPEGWTPRNSSNPLHYHPI